MSRLTAAQQRYLDNATLIGACKLVFQQLENTGVPIRLLSEVADTTSGGTPDRKNSTYYGGSIPWIKSGELNDGFIEQAEEFITQEGLQNSSAKIYPKGTLVIALYGATVGKTGILGIDAASNQAVCAVTPKTKEVTTQFLFWFLRNKRPDFLSTSFGGAQPNISQKVLRETALPVPSPDLQKKICSFLEVVERRQAGNKLLSLPALPSPLTNIQKSVARIEELAAKVEEARGLRSETIRAAEALTTAFLTPVLKDASTDACLGEVLLEKPRNGWSARCDNLEAGIPILSLGAVTGFVYRSSEYKRTSEPTSSDAHYWLKEGDLLITRSNTPELVGHAAIYDGSPSPCIYPDLMMRLVLDEERADKKFVHYWLQSTLVRDYISNSAKGTSPTMKKISQGTVMNIPFPSQLTLLEQKQLVDYLDSLQFQLVSLRRLQAKTAAELDALLPSILDKAFKGEL